MSADSRKGMGLAPGLAIYDELGSAPGRELYDALDTGLGKRPGSKMIVISTQANRDDHVMSELVDHGEKVLAGTVTDPSFYAAIYRAADGADPWAEATWRSCNPALGDFLDLKDFRRQADQAKRSPGAEPAFLNLRLNRRVSSVAGFIGSADWLACADPVDPAELEGQACWCALDTSSTTDLAALVAYFPDAGGAVLAWFWTPAATVLEREHKDRAPYSAWARSGLMLTTPGRTIDLRAPVLKIGELMDRFDVRGVAHDRWRIAELRRLLDEEGVPAKLVEHGQGWRDFAPSCDAAERAILQRRLRHGGNAVLTWNCSNTKVVLDASGNRKPDKSASNLRIDGMVALIEAIGIASREPPAPIYDFEDCVLVA